MKGTTMMIRLTRLAAFVLASAAIAQPLRAQEVYRQTEAKPAPVGSLIIENLDALWTATGDVLHNVSIAVRNGEITAIGADLDAPDDAVVIDGRGLTAMPGIVDEHTHTAMSGGSNEGTAPVVPEVRVIDTLDPDDFGIYQALSGGVTTSQVLHGSANPIGGQGATIKMRWGIDDANQLLIAEAPRTVKFALGENVTQKNRSGMTQRFPASRAGVEAVYDQAFTAAREYQQAWEEYRRDPDEAGTIPRRDLRLETLVDIMEGRIRVHAHSYRSDEILMLMRVAERYGFRIDAFTHVLEGYRVADEMAAHGAGGSTFSDWWMYKLEAFEAIPYNAAIMHEKGVLTSLNSDIPWLQASMLYEMQKPVKYGGVSKQDAMQMMTLNGAKQLHIDHLVGSLEVGKNGDILLLNGDPFNTFTRVEKTIIDGIVYYDRTNEEAERGEPVRRIADAPAVAPAPAAPLQALDLPIVSEVPSVPVVQKLTDPIDRSPVVAIIGGTVHPVSRSPIANGTVLIRDGVIEAVGAAADVSVPAAARRVDASGRHVYPGMIDPLTSVGMIDIESISSARDDREVGAFNPHMRALFSVNSYSDGIFVGRANGITSILTAPATGTVRGTGSVIALKGDTPEQMAIDAENAVVIDFPSPRGDDWEEPKLDGDDLLRLMDLFRRAELFAARPSALRDPTAPWEVNVDASDRVLLEAMVPVVTGATPTIFVAHSERDLRTLFMFLDSFPTVRAVVGGGAQAYHVAPELAERSIPVIVGSTFEPTPFRDDPITAAWRNAAILRANGVTVSFTTSFSPEGASELRNLPYAAAKAVAYGMPRDEAYRAVTLSAAEILGLDDVLGSIDPGKRADLIITTGDPLQILSQVEQMWIGGEEVPLASKHTQLYEQFRNRSVTPVTADAAAAPAGGGN
ncbi:MAG TPA: amidohydrolase family protein [Longimicrobiales bacterium]|nr:amidohydrolase family protein [Longimicrobiales bacterium]